MWHILLKHIKAWQWHTVIVILTAFGQLSIIKQECLPITAKIYHSLSQQNMYVIDARRTMEKHKINVLVINEFVQRIVRFYTLLLSDLVGR